MLRYCGALAFESATDAALNAWLAQSEILWAKLDGDFDGNLLNLRKHIVDLKHHSSERPVGYIRVILIRGTYVNT